MLESSFFPWAEFDRSANSDWRRLFNSTDAAPDLSVEWAEALIEAHKIPIDQLLVLQLSDRGGPVRAVIPLRLEQRKALGLSIVSVSLLNNTFSLHLGVLSDLGSRECTRALFDALSARPGGWSTLVFDGVGVGSELARAVDAEVASRGLRLESNTGSASPYLKIEGDWEGFVRGKSANFRANVKRKLRRLMEAGEIDIRFVTDPSGLDQAMGAIRKIEVKSWKAEEGTAITDRVWEQDFYQALVSKFGKSGQLLITLVTRGSVPLAFDLTLIGGGKGYCLKTSFDAEFAELSAGAVLRAELMKRIFSLGLQEYDFLGKSERYKLEWSETTTVSSTMKIINRNSLPGAVLSFRSQLKEVLMNLQLRFGKSRPTVEHKSTESI